MRDKGQAKPISKKQKMLEKNIHSNNITRIRETEHLPQFATTTKQIVQLIWRKYLQRGDVKNLYHDESQKLIFNIGSSRSKRIQTNRNLVP